MKNIQLGLLLVGLFCSVELQAAPSDSLVRWSEIKFVTAFERSSFRQFLKEDNKDYLKAFLANSPTGEEDLRQFDEKLSKVLQEINSSPAMRKKNANKVKFVYQTVHDRFLSKYEAESQFYEIIKTGNYNCVTATALYALFFEKLGIPYAIKEEPTHVYLVAYPNAENVLIETTTPLSGFHTFNVEFKANYVGLLKKQKIIGGSEGSSSVDELFNKYYFGTEDISFTQLIGIHFLNDGIFKYQNSDLAGGYEQIKKGYVYYPSTRSEYLLMSVTADHLAGITEPLQRSMLIGNISRFKKTGITSDMVKGEFSNLTQTVLSQKNDKDLYKKCYHETLRNIQDPELAGEISYIYYYENGRIFYNQGNYARAKPFFAKALETQPNNVDLGGIFVSCLAQSFRNEKNNTAIVDSLESYNSRFPSLNENNNFHAMKSLAYAVEFGQAFGNSNIARGLKYQQLFEGLYEADQSLLSRDAVGHAYAEACVYYFKKGQKAKAKELLDKGLQIVPDSYELKTRRMMINGR